MHVCQAVHHVDALTARTKLNDADKVTLRLSIPASADPRELPVRRLRALHSLCCVVFVLRRGGHRFSSALCCFLSLVLVLVLVLVEYTTPSRTRPASQLRPCSVLSGVGGAARGYRDRRRRTLTALPHTTPRGSWPLFIRTTTAAFGGDGDGISSDLILRNWQVRGWLMATGRLRRSFYPLARLLLVLLRALFYTT